MRFEPLLITDKAIDQLPFATRGQYNVRDAEMKGFFLKIGKTKKSFMVRGDFWRAGRREFSVQKKVGEFGMMSAREARCEAKGLLAKFARGEKPSDPNRMSGNAVTLSSAWHRYRDAHMIRKGRGERTIENYRDYMERLLTDWLDIPLVTLSANRDMVVRRHEDLSVKHGPYIANSVMKVLRAIYNHAARGNPEIPAYNPVLAVDWNAEHRRDTAMGEDDLREWFEKLNALNNPLRREFHLFTLLSGSRPLAIKEASLEHIDFRKRVLHIPKPKGGADKAFDIPLSRQMISCLIRAIKIGRMMFPVQAEYWIFPSDSESGHLVHHKEKRDRLPKWGNDLRQTYRTMSQVAEVSELDIHLLMNHSLRGVNAGYITRERLVQGHLRKQQQRISNKIFEAFGSDVRCRIGFWLMNALTE